MKILKLILIIAVLLVLLLIAGVLFALSQINAIAKTGIEKGSTYALGVNTTVASVNIGLFSGTFSMNGLNVANPQGYPGPHFLKLGNGSVAVSLASLNQPTIEVPTFSLSDLDVRLEKTDGAANYQVILDNLGRLSSGKPADPNQPAPTGDEKKLVINELTLRNIKVHVDLLKPAGAIGDVVGKATAIDIPIKEIKLTNVGKTGTGVGGTGVTVSQLSSIIVQAVLAAVAENGAGVLPADLLGDLKGKLGNLDGLKGLGMQAVGGVTEKATEAAKQVTEGAKEAVKDATKKGEEAVKKGEEAVKKGLENLLPGKK